MKKWVTKAMDTHSLLIILFHGVGGGNALDVSLTSHREFLKYLKQNENEIWIGPMIDANILRGINLEINEIRFVERYYLL